MANEIIETGFSRTRYQELREEKAEIYKNSLGLDIKTDRSSVFGQLISIDTQAEDELAGLIQVMLDAFNPFAATDVALSRLAAGMGITRKKGQKALVQMSLEVTRNNTQLHQGYTVRNPNGEEFENPTAIVLDIGTHSVTFQSKDFGVFPSSPNTLTNVATPVFGVTNVTNPFQSIDGTERENDAQLRARLSSGVQGSSQTATGVLRAINNVQGVRFAKLFDPSDPNSPIANITSAGVFIVIDGGQDADISRALIDDGVAGGVRYIEPAGIAMTQGTYVNPVNGQTHTASWARPLDTPVFVEVEAKGNSSVTTIEIETIKSLIAAEINGLGLVGGIFYASALFCSLKDKLVNTVVNQIKISGDNVTFDDFIDLGLVGKMTTEQSNITVNLT